MREYRSPEEAFKADSLATLAAAPLTLGHPTCNPPFVSPDNYARLAVGHVGDEVKQDGNHVAAKIVIQDKRAIDAVEKGMRQLSCGYVCDVVKSPGTTPNGERYDCLQTNVRFNHAALVSLGRAGTAALRLDSAGDEILDDVRLDNQENHMHKERIDGVDYDVGSDAHRAACKRRDDAEADRAQKHAAMQKAKDQAEARADTAEKKLADADKTIAAFGERLDAAVNERVELQDKARAILGKEEKLDGLTARQIREKVIAKSAPEIKLDGKSDDYVQAMFDSFAGDVGAKRAERKGNADVRRNVESTTRGDEKKEPTIADIRRKAREDSLNAWQKPLAITASKGE